MVDAGPLDLGAVPRGRRVIQAKEQPLRTPGHEGHGDPHQEETGAPLRSPAEAGEEVVAGAEVRTQAGSAGPAGNRSATPSEKQSREQQDEAGLLPGVEKVGKKD